jgi:two-component system phosphate regulon sensor histidine kinase PhoR
MKFKSIRSRLVLLTTLILALSLTGSAWIANTAFSSTLRKTTYAELADNAAYLSTLITSSSPDPWLGGHFQAYAQSTSTRITLIDREGVVLFDSEYPIQTLDNHLWREEIQAALDTGVATSERKSATQGLPVLYYALRINDHPTVSVLRLSRALDQLVGYQRSYLNLFFGGLGVLILLSLVITAFSITMLTRPLELIKALSRRYAQGDLSAHTTVESPQELSDLSKTMQEMAFLLKTKLEEVESDKTQLETILENLSEGLLLLDTSLVIQVANHEALALLTESEHPDLVGKRLDHIISSREVLIMCNACMEDGKPHSMTIAQYGHLFGETALVVGKRKTKTLKLLACAVVSSGKMEGVVLSINDMTELRRLENIRKEFVANVSHELKTPITSIAGFSEALLDSSQKEERQHFLYIINRQAIHMQHIVEDLLLLSSLEQQNASPVKTWTMASQILEETEEQCKYRFEEKGSILTIKLINPENLDLFVNGMLIVQALTNLVINALTYSEAGSEVILSLKLDEKSALFTVQDSGIGIPKEDAQRIFERFYRVDAGRSRSQGGTGLGLSIVKHIVAVHGGVVSVASTMGKGSTFTIKLPRSTSELNDMKAKSDSLYQL